MSENKRLITVFAVILIIVGIILLISFWPEKDTTFACDVKSDGDYKKLGSIDYKQYECLAKKNDTNAIVVSESLSKSEKKNLNNAATKVGHALYYVNMDKVSKKELSSIEKDLAYKDKKSFEKDAIVVIKKGEVKDYKEDVLGNNNDIYNFLKDAGLSKFACEVSSNEEYKNIGDVTYDQYKCLLESGDPFVLVVEQTTCGYCQKFNPIIDEYAGENNIPIYAIQVNTLSDEDRTEFQSSLTYFAENTGWGTPLTLAIKDKEVKMDLGGYTDDTSDLDEAYKSIGLK